MEALSRLTVIRLSNPTPLISPSGMSSVLLSRKPTTSAGIGSPSLGLISQMAPTDVSGQYPSITRPTTWVTLPCSLIGLADSTAL